MCLFITYTSSLVRCIVFFFKLKTAYELSTGDWGLDVCSSDLAQAARAAGCPVVLVRYGYNHGEPVDGVDADAHVDSLVDIPYAFSKAA